MQTKSPSLPTCLAIRQGCACVLFAPTVEVAVAPRTAQVADESPAEYKSLLQGLRDCLKPDGVWKTFWSRRLLP
jgi:hypothetical protein